MSKFLTLSLVILMISISGAQSDDSLMHRSHEKLKQAQQEMEIIKKTDDPVEKEKLLDQDILSI